MSSANIEAIRAFIAFNDIVLCYQNIGQKQLKSCKEIYKFSTQMGLCFNYPLVVLMTLVSFGKRHFYLQTFTPGFIARVRVSA